MSLSVMEGTLEYINIVRKYEAIYNVTHPDYKNLEAKSRTWKLVAQEAGTTVEACKRKWKNLRDSYTKYLRSFRAGTKTSKKYQYWAHAHHMDFLKPYQGPGRTNGKQDPYENLDNQMHQIIDDGDSDLGLHVLKKFATSDSDIELQENQQNQNDSTVANLQQSLENRSETHSHTGYGMLNANESIESLTKKRVLGSSTATSSHPIDQSFVSPQSQSLPLRISIRPKNPANLRKKAPPISAEIKKLARNMDMTTIVRANREVDATCLFFLSLAKSVAGLPKKQQIKVKMRCMKIVSEAELEYDNNVTQMESNINENNPGKFYYINKSQNQTGGTKYSEPYAHPNSNANVNPNHFDRSNSNLENNGENSEHFEYVMSPSKVEGLIDISSEEEN